VPLSCKVPVILVTF